MSNNNPNVNTKQADLRSACLLKKLQSYDLLGQLSRSTDPAGNNTDYSYDMLGRLTRRTHPDAGTTTCSYDPAGNVTQQVTANGTISYSYNYNRLTQKNYSRLTGNNVTYTYGTSGDETGRVTDIQDGSGQQQIFYDEMGNISRNIRTFAIPSGMQNVTYWEFYKLIY